MLHDIQYNKVKNFISFAANGVCESHAGVDNHWYRSMGKNKRFGTFYGTLPSTVSLIKFIMFSSMRPLRCLLPISFMF